MLWLFPASTVNAQALFFFEHTKSEQVIPLSDSLFTL
jgi:hypothetical protein